MYVYVSSLAIRENKEARGNHLAPKCRIDGHFKAVFIYIYIHCSKNVSLLTFVDFSVILGGFNWSKASRTFSLLIGEKAYLSYISTIS